MATDWMDGGCGTGPDGSLARFRLLDDGHIEIEADGIPSKQISSAVLQWSDMIWAAAEKYDLPAHIIAAFMNLESVGNPNAISPAGALGLMQLMPKTAQGVAGNPSPALTQAQILDPETNIDLGVKLIREFWEHYDGNIVKISFNYNAGRDPKTGQPWCGPGYCCKTRGDEDEKGNRPCLERVPGVPNRWNMRADCCQKYLDHHPDRNLVCCDQPITVDYAGKVIAWANGALDGPFSPSNAPTPPSGGTTPPVVPPTMRVVSSTSGLRKMAVAGGVFGALLGIGMAVMGAKR